MISKKLNYYIIFGNKSQRIVEETATRFSDKRTVQLGTVYGCNFVQSTKNNQPKIFEKLLQLSDNSSFRQVAFLQNITPVNIIKVKDCPDDSYTNRSRSAQKTYSEKDKFKIANSKSSLRSLIYFPLANTKNEMFEENKCIRNKIKVIKDVSNNFDSPFQTIGLQRINSNSPQGINNFLVDDQSHIKLHNIFKKRQQAEEGLKIQESSGNYAQCNREIHENKKQIENQTPRSISPIKTNYLERSHHFNNQIQVKITQNLQNNMQQTITLIKKKMLGPPSLYSRLKKNSEQFKNIENLIKSKAQESHEQNMQEYLKRIGCTDKNKKVFCFNSQDQFVYEVLTELGWIENKLFKSDLFHLKWIYTDTNKDYENLKEGQFFNHFQNNQELTNKGRLLRNIRLYLTSQPHLQKYFPVQFDVTFYQQKEDFIKEYQKFEILKKFKQASQNLKSNLSQEQITKLQQIYQTKFIEKDKVEIDEEFVKYFNLNQQLKESFQQIQQISQQLFQHLGLIQNSIIDELNSLYQSLNDYLILTKERENDSIYKTQIFILSISINLENSLYEIFPYTDFSNFWIIKPCGSSKQIFLFYKFFKILNYFYQRGQGLQIMTDDSQIINYTNQLSSRLVQKYIERIYICKSQLYPQLYNKKFDLRLWVLVKSFNPLQVYYYKDAYLRVCSSEYNLSDTRNMFSHFTNYSINKNKFILNKNVEDSAISLKLLKNIFKKEHGISYQKQIQPKINEIIIHSLKSVEKKIKQNSSCFEIYGFDIIFDEQFNPYLLEVNLSPACSKRNEFISKLQKEMFISTMNILFNTQYISIQNWKKIKIFDQTPKQTYENNIQISEQQIIPISNTIQTEYSQERYNLSASTIQRWYRQKKLIQCIV